jgi:hypothetical protein
MAIDLLELENELDEIRVDITAYAHEYGLCRFAFAAEFLVDPALIMRALASDLATKYKLTAEQAAEIIHAGSMFCMLVKSIEQGGTLAMAPDVDDDQ